MSPQGLSLKNNFRGSAALSRWFCDLIKGKDATPYVLRVAVFEQQIVFEGGSIDVNGCGTCLTTEQCLLNPNRNPHLGRSEIEKVLRKGLGVDHFIWLGQGIVGDDTDGHIDDIARFVDPTTVVCALEEDPKNENYVPLREN